ncbi:molybdate ABC transporter substrate-binding protein [Rhodobacteraceae bacterium NNCM2]|nr:molybdate ABC transporter substrate-binding protein [Coraliihabitans acroporae]
MRHILLLIAILAPLHSAGAADLRVAVAANFRQVLRELAPKFQDETGHSISISAGSTGQLASQILQGAPFDVFLAADSQRVGQLVDLGAAIGDTVVTYAIGKLALIGPATGAATPAELLTNAKRIALANPRTAPYGEAAEAYLRETGLWDEVAGRLVLSGNVSGAFAAVQSGAADVGLVAYSSVVAANVPYLPLTAEGMAPIRQEAVLLTNGQENPAAEPFLAFLLSPEAKAVIEQYGYDVH